MSGSERQAKYRRTAKGKNTRKTYMHNTSTWQTETKYLARPFVAWDGEGVTVADGSHRYTLLASSSGFTVEDNDGLSTSLIFRTLIAGKNETPDGIHVIYGGSYDFNMWLRDFSERDRDRLYEAGRCFWNDYLVVWRRGKSFRITDRNSGITITIYDVVSFFQCPFVKACDDYLGERFIERDMIVANKAARGSFTIDDAAKVAEYNDAELTNLVNLMTELRERLVKVKLRPKRWDGPGAIATALLQREGIKDAMTTCPDDVAEAARYAYAGGRFEVVKCGDVIGAAYEYDINSAYPAALRNVPNLARGRWLAVDRPLALSDDNFGLWYVEWEGQEQNLWLPQPFFHRAPDGSVSYPLRNAGWYWSPEIVTAQAYVERYGGSLEIKRGYVFIPADESDKPFSFIDGMYLKRQALKKAGDGAHVGLKLGLNSLYGKTCQRVGWNYDPQTGQYKLPPFHQLEWAGYVTSWCRAQVLRAALENLESVIAFETDAMFTTEPLPVKVGPGLGEWEQTAFTSLAYLQSGLYFGQTTKGETIEKTRGVDRGSLTYSQCQKGLRSASHSDRYVDSYLTRFIGIGLARALNDWTRWCRWETSPKRVKLEPDGKRVHDNCIECSGGNGFASGTWHETYPPLWSMKQSNEYPIPWINPNPDMTELDEWAAMHREEMAADYE